ncbi:MAG TPA: aminopeptidase [Steroidobacteraceae bacterium]|jgi:predicted aminopeptidase|nr:aminopeptidase [Steroidobacteraceae bacterium]
MVAMVTETFTASARGALTGPPLRALAALVTASLLAGCGTAYVWQATSGEYHVLHAREPIAKVIADPATKPAVRERLEVVESARKFASADLGLPDNKSYTSYADIGRPYVVWNVVAAPEFSLTPHHWCFPVAGCVAYRGYFSEEQARAFAAHRAVAGDDVAIDGVPAYSTLGKFADPVLSSMLRYGDDELVAMIFHELAHQLIYVKDDSAFNEAFATTVEDAGLERWLKAQGKPERMAQFLKEQERAQRLIELLAAGRAELIRLYGSGVPPAVMRERKAAILHQLGVRIAAFERTEGVSYPLYDEWVSKGLNNARLASVATYYDCVPGLMKILAQEDNDLPRFYAAVRELAGRTRAARHAQLCPADAATEQDDAGD